MFFTESTSHVNGNGANGHLSNGHGANGHISNGHGMNGHTENGHDVNGHSANGHGTNGGHNANGQHRVAKKSKMTGFMKRKLFTPGPLSTSPTVKQEQLTDIGCREDDFVEIIKFIRERLVHLAGGTLDKHSCVLLQGCGTYGVEAALMTSIPKSGGKVLVLANGAYSKRIGKICGYLDVDFHMEVFPENERVEPARVQTILSRDTDYTHVAMVHCETSSGVINPVHEIGHIIKDVIPDAVFVVDGMSSLGAIPVDIENSKIDYFISSANKCIQGVPGFTYVIARIQHLLSCKGHCRSFSLDLVDQYLGFEFNGQFRFTPPTHAIQAFKQALIELEEEGGIEGRADRYKSNRNILREGMSKLGFQEFLDSSHDGYIITSYLIPNDPKFDYLDLFYRLSQKGQVIYPGQVLEVKSFRLGNIGHLFPDDMRHLLQCLEDSLHDMHVTIPVIY